MRLFILGSSGFIGQNIVEHFQSMKNVVVYGADFHRGGYVSADRFTHLDATSKNDLDRLVDQIKPDYIINLAAKTDLQGQSSNDYYCNVKIVQNLVKVLEKNTRLKLVHFSSMLADPVLRNSSTDMQINWYGESKLKGEKILCDCSLNAQDRFLILRPTSVWGKYFHEPYIDFFWLIARRRYLNIGERRYKSFGYIDTVIQQLEACLYTWPQEQLFIVGDQTPYELECFSKSIAKAFGVGPPLVISKRILHILSWLFEKIIRKEINPLPKRRLKNLLSPIIYDPDEIKYIQTKKKIDISIAIQDTVNWMRAKK